jgi:hypothetical protein
MTTVATTAAAVRAAPARAGGLRWIGASAIGFGVGFGGFMVAEEALGHPEDGGLAAIVGALIGPGPANLLGHSVAMAVMGTIIGLAQAQVLHEWLGQRGRWILATATGFAVALAVGGLLLLPAGVANGARPIPKPFDLPLAFVLAATLAAGLQWLTVLRRRVRGAGWWLVVSPVAVALGLAFGVAMAFSLAALVGEDGFHALGATVVPSLVGMLGGALVGAVTWAFLAPRLRTHHLAGNVGGV